MFSNLFKCLLFFAVVLFHTVSHAGIVSIDDRKMIPEDKYVDPSTVAILSGTENVVCSGSTIGLMHVITAAHCVYDTETQQLRQNLTIKPGMHLSTNRNTSARFHIKRVFILKNYIEDIGYNGYTSYASSKDIAILQVRDFEGNTLFSDLSPALKIKAFPISTLKEKSLQIISYGTGGGVSEGSQYYQANCSILNQRYNYTSVTHDCDTLPGMSGMSLVVDRGTVAAVHSGEASGVDSGLNSAALVTEEILPEINKITAFEYEGLEKFQQLNYVEPSHGRLQIINDCNKTILVGIHYANMSGDWVSAGFYSFEPGESQYFHEKILSGHFYMAAYSEDRSLEWTGSHPFSIRGDTHQTIRQDFDNYHSDQKLRFTCN